ncbi:MAG: 16S rRNA (guanine(966)-N(2))-methyltransferase RsmD [Gammaproteobacteria bacterium]|nr:16S rRNA (guanine(966)-N(2))-methyltransferase RsmD [Gammaproteobacteria bacterium]
MARANRRPGSLRIIAGRWRGRRIPLPDNSAVRPTGDRVRETLFNWLQAEIRGARCLDLFAGSGALGLEALSRGAATVTFVDTDPGIARHLDKIVHELGDDTAEIVVADAHRYLGGSPTAFDIIFLDPPFGNADLGNLCTLLAGGWLAPGARVYLETGRDQDLPELPSGGEWLRQKTAGKVRYALAGFS